MIDLLLDIRPIAWYVLGAGAFWLVVAILAAQLTRSHRYEHLPESTPAPDEATRPPEPALWRPGREEP